MAKFSKIFFLLFLTALAFSEPAQPTYTADDYQVTYDRKTVVVYGSTAQTFERLLRARESMRPITKEKEQTTFYFQRETADAVGEPHVLWAPVKVDNPQAVPHDLALDIRIFTANDREALDKTLDRLIHANDSSKNCLSTGRCVTEIQLLMCPSPNTCLFSTPIKDDNYVTKKFPR